MCLCACARACARARVHVRPCLRLRLRVLKSLLWRSRSVASLACSTSKITRKPRFSPIFTDDQLLGRYFTEFYSIQQLCTMVNHILNIVLHPQFVGITDSADFQGPLARPVSGDFQRFFAQEYDAHPIGLGVD